MGDDNAKLTEICARNYKAQAIWFLNAYWNKFGEAEAETIWNIYNIIVELDVDNKKEGTQVDEFNAHRLLEKMEETLSVRAMRERLTSMGVEKIKYVPLLQYLVFRYHEKHPDVVSLHHVVNASQGDNQDEVDEAQRLLDAALAALDSAVKAAEEARAAEEAARTAQAELEAAQAELKAQEDAYHAKTDELKRKSEEGGIVSRNRAKNELAQHLGEDPLPLRRAKLNTDAAVRKAEKATAAAEAARHHAEEELAAAEAAAAEAQAYLDEVKSKEGSAQGALWWIDRELHEAKKYMPTSKGGIRK